MSATLFLRKTVGGLKPSNRISQEAYDAIPLNAEVKAEITRPRHLVHHRKWFALLQVIFPHQTAYPTMDSFLAAIKCALGHGETVKLPDGRTVLVPGSISFAKLDQAEFSSFYDRALDLIVTRILPGIGREDVEREVEEILAGREAA
jgi:hypothetical protein